MYTKISDYVTCYNPYCIAIHIAYDIAYDTVSYAIWIAMQYGL